MTGHDLYGRRSAAEVSDLEVEGWDVDVAAQSLIDAIRAARLREDSTPEMARKLEWEIDQVVQKLRAFRHSPFRPHVIELVTYSLAIGLRSALPEGRLIGLLQAVRRSHGNKGGKTSGEKRRENAAKWQKFVRENALAIRASNPTLSQHDLAGKIESAADSQSVKVARSRIVQFISQLEKDGVLPRRSQQKSQ